MEIINSLIDDTHSGSAIAPKFRERTLERGLWLAQKSAPEHCKLNKESIKKRIFIKAYSVQQFLYFFPYIMINYSYKRRRLVV